jgi:Trk-type K+ transport system membrane component
MRHREHAPAPAPTPAPPLPAPSQRPSQLHMITSRVNFADFEEELEVKIGAVRKFFANNVTYFGLHVAYFLTLSFVGAIILYFNQEQTADFMDCLFLAVSTGCVNGLFSADFTKWKVSSQIVLMIWMLLGNQILFSVVPVVIRKAYFRKGFSAINPNFPGSPAHKRSIRKAHRKAAEYRALTIIQRTALSIYFGTQLVAAISLGAYFHSVPSRRKLCDDRNVNPWFFGAFLTVSAFCNVGISLFPDNMIPLHDDYFTLIICSILILVGNTAYPIVARFIIFVLHRMNPKDSGLKYLLKNPRRCYTHMFPAIHTKILLAAVTGFTLAEYAAFLALDWNSYVLAGLRGDVKSLSAFFQAVATRTAGFNVCNMFDLAPAVIVFYCFTMYVSSYPVAGALRLISEHKSEKSPGSEADDELSSLDTVDDEIGVAGKESKTTWAQVKRILISEVWILFLGLFLICAADNSLITGSLKIDPFYILFECSSAYGTVGLSVGHPSNPCSLSFLFCDFSKFVVIMIMFIGRHRSMPRSIDHAVHFPGLLNVPSTDRSRNSSISKRFRSSIAPNQTDQVATRAAFMEIVSIVKHHQREHELKRSDSVPILPSQMSSADLITQTAMAVTRVLKIEKRVPSRSYHHVAISSQDLLDWTADARERPKPRPIEESRDRACTEIEIIVPEEEVSPPTTVANAAATTHTSIRALEARKL